MVEKSEAGRLAFPAQQSAPHLLFGIKDTVFGVHVGNVHEIVLLPELKMLAERKSHFIGAVNLRGNIVPVMDLELRFGRKLGCYSLNDYLLVLESGGKRVAVVVNDVLGVKQLDLKQDDNTANDSTEREIAASCIHQMVSVDDQIVMLLNIDGLFSSAGPVEAEYLDEDAATELPSITAGASDVELAVFRRRANQLRQSSLGLEADEMTSLAVAEISGEFYAFELDYVREFFEVQEITPVPCCPAKIIGNVNLRGDVVTVIDVRGQLNLPSEDRIAKGKVIIAQTDEMTVGVLVDALHGVTYLPSAEVTSLRTAVNAATKGTAPFRETMMSIVDVPSLLALDRWVIDEEVGHR